MTTMDILRRTTAAWPSICNASAEDKNRILSAMADSLQAECDAILRCNAEDMDAARGHISDVMLDRLYLDKDRIDAMADGIRATVALPDHTGRILAQIDHPNSMKIYKKQVPLGLVAIIYESRPNVTSDAAALTIKSGNVCMLRSGKELTIFTVKNQDMARFVADAKRYGVVYCVLREAKDNPQGISEIMVRAEDAAIINRIVENFKIATVSDPETIRESLSGEEKETSGQPAPEQTHPQKNEDDRLLDEMLSGPADRQETLRENPTAARTERSRPSEPSSKTRETSEGASNDGRPSVRED